MVVSHVWVCLNRVLLQLSAGRDQVMAEDQLQPQKNGGRGKRGFSQHMRAVFSKGRNVASAINTTFLTGRTWINYWSLLLYANVR